MVITLTDQASLQIKEMMQEEENPVYFRFGIQGGSVWSFLFSWI